jgi:adenylate cyclase
MKNQLIFYTGGGLFPDYPHYIVRRADQDAMRSLNDGKFIFVNAPRQMGKTSLLNRIGAKLELQGWLCSSVDL